MAVSACVARVGSYFFFVRALLPRPFGERASPAFVWLLLCVCWQRPGLAPAGELLCCARQQSNQKSASATLPAELSSLLRRSVQTCRRRFEFLLEAGRDACARRWCCAIYKELRLFKCSDSVFATVLAGRYSLRTKHALSLLSESSDKENTHAQCDDQNLFASW